MLIRWQTSKQRTGIGRFAVSCIYDSLFCGEEYANVKCAMYIGILEEVR